MKTLIHFFFAFAITVQAQQTSVPATMDRMDDFTVHLSAPRTRLWGGNQELPRHFEKEFLPTFFVRELTLDSPLAPATTLQWIFTGAHGGITISLTGRKLTLTQRYYDSFALNADNPPTLRYPSKTWLETSKELSNDPHRISLALEEMQAVLRVDDQEIMRQECLLDLERHQIDVSAPANATGDLHLTIERPKADNAHVTIDPKEIHQSIYGFGGIVSFPAFFMMSKDSQQQWFQLIKENNLLIQREYPTGVQLKPDLSNFDNQGDARPHYYGDNFPNGESSNFAYSRHIHEIGGHVLFEFWTLPPWVQTPGTKQVNTEEYARAVVGYCKHAQAQSGQPPEIVGIQNEVIQDADTWIEMITHLRNALDAAGFRSVKIHMPDASDLSSGISSATALHKNPRVWAMLDYSATHIYDYQRNFGDPEALNPLIARWNEQIGSKPFLATELAINKPRYQAMDSYRISFAQAQLYHKLLSSMDAKILAYCWLLLDIEEPTFGPTRSLFVVDRGNSFEPRAAGYSLRTFTAFSRHLPEGIDRVGASSSDPGVLVDAFTSTRFGQTLILLNQSTRPKKVDWSGIPGTFLTMEIVDAYHAATLSAAPRNRTVDLSPGEIVTLTNVRLRSNASGR
jgi:hypothetical protein